MTTTLIPSTLRIVSIVLICSVFSTCFSAPDESLQKTTNQAATPMHSNETDAAQKAPDLLDGRVSVNGGQVLIDGSLRVYEPIYSKTMDLVEVSTSITPISNHVRLYVVAVGTYSVIKAQFDNGAVITLGNN